LLLNFKVQEDKSSWEPERLKCLGRKYNIYDTIQLD
jgi:hypothetical protein